MNLAEIVTEIEKLESAETNWTNVQRLAMLYVVKDHMQAAPQAGAVPKCTGGEFTEACCGVDMQRLFDVMEEHMMVVKTLHPKEYRSVLNRIADMRD